MANISLSLVIQTHPKASMFWTWMILLRDMQTRSHDLLPSLSKQHLAKQRPNIACHCQMRQKQRPWSFMSHWSTMIPSKPVFSLFTSFLCSLLLQSIARHMRIAGRMSWHVGWLFGVWNGPPSLWNLPTIPSFLPDSNMTSAASIFIMPILNAKTMRLDLWGMHYFFNLVYSLSNWC